MIFNRNNLDKEPSPYLKQHQNSPINWQSWSNEILEYAKSKDKLILLSVGYSTCHWCHVMSLDTFNNLDIANYLNEHFVSIQVDKEQRPDIDSYYMEFINRVLGRGGWPLNIILTPDLKPIFAGTYFPSYSEFSLPGFREILEQVVWWYRQNKGKITDFHPYTEMKEVIIEDERIVIEPIIELFDKEYGGFGQQTKFPPYNTLIFLLSYVETNKSNLKLKKIIKKTLDVMQLRGLHDHLQGGFFRYTSDRGWAIPRFEKMLYDQAMMLWVYSLAYKIFKDSAYKKTVQKTIKCLEDCFNDNGSYITGFDAGMNEMDSYYLWSIAELGQYLTAEESVQFFNTFELYSTESLNGKNHLVKKKNLNLDELEEKLLYIRNQRERPFVDKKILTNWNALTAVAFIMAYRYAGISEAKEKAINIYHKLMKDHFINNKLTHSFFEGSPQPDAFISDYSALLLLATYIYEEKQDNLGDIELLRNELMKFKINNLWYKNALAENFTIIPGETLDYPVPSDVSLSEFALFRTQLILGTADSAKTHYKVPLQNDFYNLYAFLKNGNYHHVYSPNQIDWRLLPINCIQLQNQTFADSYNFEKKKFNNPHQLVDYLNNPNDGEKDS